MRASPLLLFILLVPASFAQIYSWRDADGQMHYSDQPPTGVAKPRKLETTGAPPEDSEAARRKLAQEEMDFRKRQLDAAEADAKAAKSAAELADRQDNCRKAKAYLQTLESGVRISRSNDKGEPAFLDEQGRQQEIGAARRAADSWCK